MDIEQDISDVNSTIMSTVAGGQALSGAFRAEYEIADVLGQGTMGVVYAARRISDDKKVAVKFSLANEKDLEARFRREARILSYFDHPNIMEVLDNGVEQGLPYIVCERIEGDTLKHVLRYESPLPIPKILEFSLGILRGLHYSHDQEVLHRDLKSENIMITTGGLVKVCDFGLAADDHDGERLTKTGIVLGTPQYMAPELVQGGKAAVTTDLYSIGCILFEMTTGSLPYPSDNPDGSSRKVIEVLWSHVQDPVPSPAARRLGCPPALDDLIQALLDKKPAARPQTAAEVITRIESLQRHMIESSSIMTLDGILGDLDPEASISDSGPDHDEPGAISAAGARAKARVRSPTRKAAVYSEAPAEAVSPTVRVSRRLQGLGRRFPIKRFVALAVLLAIGGGGASWYASRITMESLVLEFVRLDLQAPGSGASGTPGSSGPRFVYRIVTPAGISVTASGRGDGGVESVLESVPSEAGFVEIVIPSTKIHALNSIAIHLTRGPHERDILADVPRPEALLEQFDSLHETFFKNEESAGFKYGEIDGSQWRRDLVMLARVLRSGLSEDEERTLFGLLTTSGATTEAPKVGPKTEDSAGKEDAKASSELRFWLGEIARGCQTRFKPWMASAALFLDGLDGVSLDEDAQARIRHVLRPFRILDRVLLCAGMEDQMLGAEVWLGENQKVLVEASDQPDDERESVNLTEIASTSKLSDIYFLFPGDHPVESEEVGRVLGIQQKRTKTRTNESTVELVLNKKETWPDDDDLIRIIVRLNADPAITIPMLPTGLLWLEDVPSGVRFLLHSLDREERAAKSLYVGMKIPFRTIKSGSTKILRLRFESIALAGHKAEDARLNAQVKVVNVGIYRDAEPED